MRFLPLLLLTPVSAAHIFACAKRREGIRKFTKVLLVPLIALLHISVCGFKHPLVLLGLFCGLVGDILLIPKGKLCFRLGGFFFLIGHVCYIAAAFRIGMPQAAYVSLGIPWLVIMAVAAFALGASAYLILKRGVEGSMRVGVAAYIATISLMAGVMVYSLGGTRCFGAFLIAAGALLFTASDFLLCVGLTRRFRIKQGRVWVMLTYIAAQLGIALGFALM
ncbi:MAG: lysoplasmalogenase [Clostridia bacterium]|nr:lysoplasmalogenase [Clostridia bacterium]